MKLKILILALSFISSPIFAEGVARGGSDVNASDRPAVKEPTFEELKACWVRMMHTPSYKYDIKIDEEKGWINKNVDWYSYYDSDADSKSFSSRTKMSDFVFLTKDGFKELVWLGNGKSREGADIVDLSEIEKYRDVAKKYTKYLINILNSSVMAVQKKQIPRDQYLDKKMIAQVSDYLCVCEKISFYKQEAKASREKILKEPIKVKDSNGDIRSLKREDLECTALVG